MSERKDGVFALSQISSVYQFMQDMLAGTKARTQIIERFLRPAAGMRIVDVGCGSASLLPYLGAVDYTGLDPNPDHIRRAQERHGAEARFHCAGADALAELVGEPYDLAMCIGVLHHLDDAAVTEVCTQVAANLKPGGRFVTIDPAFVDGQNPIARWLAAHDAGQAVRTPAAYAAFLKSRFSQVKVTVTHDLLRVPYTHCIIEAQL